MQHAYQNDSCDITKLLTPPLPLVTICYKSGDPLPPLGYDVIYGRPPRLDYKVLIRLAEFDDIVRGPLSIQPPQP